MFLWKATKCMRYLRLHAYVQDKNKDNRKKSQSMICNAILFFFLPDTVHI